MRRALFLLPLLAACTSPGPEFFGAREHRVTVEGTNFAVHHTGDRAQAIRLDHAWRGAERDLMPARLVAAIEQATGCTVRSGSEQGDTGVVTARTDC